MASNLTPQQIADKQVNNAQAAVGAYRLGVQQTQKNPMQLAIAAIPKMRANFNAAVDSGKVQAGLQSVSTAAWKNQTATTGADRYGPGIAAAKPKIVAFQQQVAPFRAQLQAQLATMPTDTLDQRLAKMVANARGMSQFQFQKPASNG